MQLGQTINKLKENLVFLGYYFIGIILDSDEAVVSSPFQYLLFIVLKSFN
jgi:hypothetical protein